MDEIWKDVVGYEGRYVVSNFGSVMSLDREVVKNNRRYVWKSKILSPFVDNGYLYVNLCDGKLSKKTAVHRIVLIAFVGPPKEGEEACHNNGVRNDARLSNLRWGTQKSNWADKWIHGTATFGENSGSAKLTKDQVLYIRNSRASSIKLSNELRVSSSTIRAVRLGVNWKNA